MGVADLEEPSRCREDAVSYREHHWNAADGRCPCGARRTGKRGAWLYFDATGLYLGPHRPICTRDFGRRRMKQLKLFD